ncbi:MAG: DUF4157 domain-containing protein [Polyangiaceae bacterium]
MLDPRRVALLVSLVLAACGHRPDGPEVAPSSPSAAPERSASTPPQSSATARDASGIRFRGSEVVFASVEDGRSLLGASDDFTRALGTLDRQLRLHTTTPVTDGAFRAHAAAQVVDWADDAKTKWSAAAAKLGAALEGISISLPKVIPILQTTGKEEFDAAYTRGSAIVLPAREVSTSGSPLQLLAHELFHVASRHDPALRARLYPLIGFKPVEVVELPAALEPKRLTNPDAFVNAFAIPVHLQSKGGSPDRSFLAVPLVYCAPPLEQALGVGLGRAIGLSLLEVDDAGKVVTDQGTPRLHDVDETDYLKVASVNTGYAIHPEEVLADNFALIVLERSGEKPDIQDRAALDRIAEALR